jgi:hypothetical protein
MAAPPIQHAPANTMASQYAFALNDICTRFFAPEVKIGGTGGKL